RLKGQGGNGKYGGEPGDLYLEVKIRHSLPQMIGDFIKKLVKRGM
ncbi:MAG: molecular chaperone DnaJ, partial [Nitrospirae bacterium CG_4_8_14_3_um_filter_41_47]